MEITYDTLHVAGPETVRDINSLLKGFTKTGRSVNAAQLQRYLESASVLVVAQAGERIVGCVGLGQLVQLGKTKGWIDDMVVDNEFRGRGIGRKLMDRAIAIAVDRGDACIDLTVGHDRAAAAALYDELGFAQRDTSIYRLTLGG